MRAAQAIALISGAYVPVGLVGTVTMKSDDTRLVRVVSSDGYEIEVNAHNVFVCWDNITGISPY